MRINTLELEKPLPIITIEYEIPPQYAIARVRHNNKYYIYIYRVVPRVTIAKLYIIVNRNYE